MEKTYSVRDLADVLGVTQRTVRFYHNKGLINADRDANHRRAFSESDRRHVQHILDRTQQGFTLSEIKHALNSGGFSPSQLKAQLEFLREQQVQVARSIAAIEAELEGEAEP